MKIPFKKVDFLKPGSKGSAEIRKISIGPEDLRAIIHDGIPVGEYTQLFVNGVLMMSDMPMEMNTNLPIYDKAEGDILIGGLGLGMILPAIVDKPEVRSVTVIENNKDVIDLVWPQLRAEYKGLSTTVKVIHGDVFNPPDLIIGRKYDYIWMDIWPNVSSDVFTEMLRLRTDYQLRCKGHDVNRFMCWGWLNARYGVKLTSSL